MHIINGDILKKILFLFNLITLTFLFPSISFSQNESSYIFYDVKNEVVIDGKNYNESSLIASTTKILTAIVTIENRDLFELVNVLDEDTKIEGSKVYIKENEHYTVLDLLYGLMLRSGNDCANALARSYKKGYQQFIKLMNDKCKELGLINSVFANPSGLDSDNENYSTALDMARLMSYAMKNDQFYKIASTHDIKIKSQEGSAFYLKNKDKLLFEDDRFIAGKTGYTKASKRVLVNYASSNGLDVVIVTINDANDWQNHKRYLNNALEGRLKLILRRGIYYINNSNYKIELPDNVYAYGLNISYLIDLKDSILYLYDGDLKIKGIKITIFKISDDEN